MPTRAQPRSAAGDVQAVMKQAYLNCGSMSRLDAALGYSIWHEDREAAYGAANFGGTGQDCVDDCRLDATLIASISSRNQSDPSYSFSSFKG